ncbi:hypothetical protein KKH43_00410 [Patescibacteria group bacterium]|nr:hypothetical protein [Patescibacteria group bacterium]
MKKKFLSSNLGLKLIAIVIAIFLWFYVANDGYRVDFLDSEVTIEAFNVAESKALAENLGEAQVKVRAPLSTWSRITDDTFSAYVDAKGLQAGEYTLPVKVVSEDPTVQVLETEPQEVRVVIDSVESEKRDIRPKGEGTPGEGYVQEEPSVTETSAMVSGAKRNVENVAEVIAPVAVDGAMSDVTQTVDLEAVDSEGNRVESVSISPKTVEVTVPVHKEEGVKTVGVKAKTKGSPPQGYWISDIKMSPSSVAIEGPEEVLSNVGFVETQSIDVSSFKGDVTQEVALDVPEDISLVGSDTVSVTVKVKSEEVARDIEKRPTFRNMPAGQHITSMTPENVVLVIEGPADVINTFDLKTMAVDVDLSGKKPGTYTLPIQKEIVTLPSGVSLKEIETKEIRIVIE